MKRVSLCIGVIMVLVLLGNIYTVQAEDYTALTQMNGKWLKLSGSVNGWTVTQRHANVDPIKIEATLNNMYACVYYDPAIGHAQLTVMNKNGTQTGIGSLYYDGGTVDVWLANTYLYLDSKGDYATNGYDMNIQAYALATTKNGAETGSITFLGAEGYIDNASRYSYFGGKLKAKIVKTAPFDTICEGFVPVPP